MKKYIFILFVLIFGPYNIIGQEASDYLGQEPPGDVPQLFAPYIISSGSHDLDITISPDGNESFLPAGCRLPVT